MLYDKIRAIEFSFSQPQEQATPLFSDSRYSAFPLSKQNFKPLEANAGVVCAVDGGNCEIIATPSFSLSLLRVFAVVFNGGKRIESETHDFLCHTQAKVDDGEVALESKLVALNETELKLVSSLSFNATDASIARSGYRASPVAMAGVYRSFLEWMLAEKKIRELGGGTVVRDGTLQTSFSGEAAFSQKAFATAREKGVNLCALAKTSSLLTTNGMPLVEAVHRIAPNGAWFYHPVAKNEHPDHQAEIFVCKLHAQSKYAFRFELLRGQELGNSLEALAFQARDPVFLGYPYCLAVADSQARVTGEEASVARSLVEAKTGVSFEELLKSERAIDAHDYL